MMNICFITFIAIVETQCAIIIRIDYLSVAQFSQQQRQPVVGTTLTLPTFERRNLKGKQVRESQ